MTKSSLLTATSLFIFLFSFFSPLAINDARAAESADAPPEESTRLTIGLRPAMIVPMGQLAKGTAMRDALGAGGGMQADFGLRLTPNVVLFTGTELGFLSRGSQTHGMGGISKSIVIEIGVAGDWATSRTTSMVGRIGGGYRYIITDLAPQDPLARSLRLPEIQDNAKLQGLELRTALGLRYRPSRSELMSLELLGHLAIGDFASIDVPRPSTTPDWARSTGVALYAFAGVSLGIRY